MHRLRKLRIRKRLALAFGLILLILVASSAMGVWKLRILTKHLNAVATTDQQKSQLAVEWLHTIALNGVRTRAALLGAPETVPELQREIDITSALSLKARNELEKLCDTPEDKQQFAQIDVKRAAFRQARDEVMKHRSAGENVQAETDTKLTPLLNAYIDEITRLQLRQKVRYEEALASANEEGSRGQQLLVACSVGGLTVAIFLAMALSRSIVVPLRQAVQSTRHIANGDLSEDILVSGSDEPAELLTALQAMQTSLSGIVTNVRSNAESVATASAQIAQGNNDLSTRTEQQAAALEETASSMEQLNSTVRQNAENAQQATRLADQASKVAMDGGAAVSAVVEKMRNISESSQRIGHIIAAIDGIAFQTNILALNAAVEAARAGEQGRGFAVVASEVRNLAQRSAEAAKEIKNLIVDSAERVEQGTVLADKAGTTMNEVVASIRQVSEIVNQISSASQEQSLGVAQVGEAVAQLDQTTQQNAALVEESAAAASSLEVQSADMVKAVAFFVVPA